MESDQKLCSLAELGDWGPGGLERTLKRLDRKGKEC